MAQMNVESMPRSLKEKQRQERKELILQAAEEVLIEKGYHETSIDEIATRVGIAKGTVYLHFPSKEDLVAALFARDVLQLLERIDRIISTEDTICAQLQAILRCMYGTLFVKRMRLLYSIYDSAKSQQPWAERNECVRELCEDLAARITSLLEKGKAAGEFDQTIPTAVMLGAFFSLLSPRNYERLLVGQEMTGDELVVYLGRLYFKGIKAC